MNQSIHKTIPQFENYLTVSKGFSHNTVKNYLSDLRYFLSWLDLKLRGRFSENKNQLLKVNSITPSLLREYQKYLLANNIAKSTVNRRLAGLRVFCQFCYNSGLLEQNWGEILKNLPSPRPREKEIHDLVSKFGTWLKKNRASDNTIKNYVADVRNYLLEVSRQ